MDHTETHRDTPGHAGNRLRAAPRERAVCQGPPGLAQPQVELVHHALGGGGLARGGLGGIVRGGDRSKRRNAPLRSGVAVGNAPTEGRATGTGASLVSGGMTRGREPAERRARRAPRA